MKNKTIVQIFLITSLLAGLLIGLIWGKAITNTQQKQNHEAQLIKDASTREFNLLMAIIYTARFNGEITPDKRNLILAILQQIGYPKEALIGMNNILITYANKLFNINDIIQQFKETSDINQRIFLFKSLNIIAAADAPLSIEKKEFLEKTYKDLEL